MTVTNSSFVVPYGILQAENGGDWFPAGLGESPKSRCKPEHVKVMRLQAQTDQIKNGSVLQPQHAPWRAEYLRRVPA